MRIATLSNAAVIHTRRWVEWFRARGHEVKVWSLEPSPASLGAVALPSLPLPGFVRYPLAVPALRAALAAFDPDVVDAHFVPNYGLIGALAGRRPLCVSAWGSDLLVTGRSSVLQRLRARFVLRRADAVIVDNRNLTRAAIELGAEKPRVHEIPWGIDPDLYRPAPARTPGLLLSTRMHEPVYDLPTLFHGVRPVLERDPAAQLLITGDGSLTPELEHLAARLFPPGRARFLGRIGDAELAELLGRAEVSLSASRSDSTALSLLEAMAAGAIPVVSDLEGHRQWVSEGDGARCFAPGDASSVTAALERALADPAWCEQARARNRAVILERGDRRVNMRRIEELFERLAAGRGTARAGAAS